MEQTLCDVDDEVFEGNGDGLEGEEFDRGVCYAFREQEVTGTVEEPRKKESNIELGV